MPAVGVLISWHSVKFKVMLNQRVLPDTRKHLYLLKLSQKFQLTFQIFFHVHLLFSQEQNSSAR